MPAPVVSDLLASEEISCPTRSSHHKLTKKLMASEETPCPRRSSKHKLTKRALVRHEHSEAQFWKRETDVDSQQLGLSKSVHYDNVTVFFSDIAGFTAMSQSVKPELVMAFLHSLYSSFDDLLEDHPTLWKVETIGDSYMVAGGLLQFPEKPNTPEEVAHDVVEFAKQALEITGNMTMPNGEACALRVGIHSGPVCTGVVGSKMPRYCLFGDTVNTASRMESTGRPGALQISESTWQLLGDQESTNWRNEEVAAKGKGVMRTHVLDLPLPHPGTSEEQKMEKPQSPLAGGQTPSRSTSHQLCHRSRA